MTKIETIGMQPIYSYDIDLKDGLDDMLMLISEVLSLKSVSHKEWWIKPKVIPSQVILSIKFKYNNDVSLNVGELLFKEL